MEEYFNKVTNNLMYTGHCAKCWKCKAQKNNNRDLAPKDYECNRRKSTCTHEQIVTYSIIGTILKIQTKPEVLHKNCIW